MTDNGPNPMQPRKCTATTRQGKRCGNWAIRGGTVCRMHGGSAPKVRANADAALELERARKIAHRLGVPLEIDPHAALSHAVHVAAGMVAVCLQQVQALGLDDVVWGIIRTDDATETATIPTDDGPVSMPAKVTTRTIRGASVHPWVRLLDEWQSQLVKASKAAIDAGVEERRVRLAEETGRQWARGTIEAIESVPSLTDSQRMELRSAIADQLQAQTQETTRHD